MDFNPHLIARVQFVSTVDNALSLDHNPNYKPWQNPAPNNVAGKGKIEEPGRMDNIVWQNRSMPPSAYENALGDALEKVFDGGATTLDEVVAGLNALAFRAPDSQPWTAQRYEAELARLGA
jgi:hypothetical protein